MPTRIASEQRGVNGEMHPPRQHLQTFLEPAIDAPGHNGCRYVGNGAMMARPPFDPGYDLGLG